MSGEREIFFGGEAETTINVRSFDFDGCLFNENYTNQFSTDYEKKKLIPTDELEEELIKRHLIPCNEILVQQITEEIQKKEFKKVILMVGSNRQDRHMDNGNKVRVGRNGPLRTGSCFPALSHLCDKLNNQYPQAREPLYSIDPYLLSDLYNKREAGHNFNDSQSTDRAIVDKSKVSLLYAQIHRIASLQKSNNVKIIYDFYDDLYSDDILEHLYVLFHANPDLIPAHVTLRLHQYAGPNNNKPNLFQIQGTGQIDFNYTKRILGITKKHAEVKSCNFFILLENKNNLAQFKTLIQEEEQAGEEKTNATITIAPPQTTPAAAVPRPNTTIAPTSTNLTPKKRNNIEREINRYIASRGRIEKENGKIKIVLNWTSRLFRNQTLTKEKLNLANQLLTALDNNESFSDQAYNINDRHENMLLLQPYKQSCMPSFFRSFRQSDFKKCMMHILKISKQN